MEPVGATIGPQEGRQRNTLSLYNALARHVLAPSLDLIRGARTMKCLADLEETQWWSRERIEQLQAERLQRLIRYAYDHVLYYRRLMDERGLRPHDIQSAADLHKLPLLTKDLIRANFDEMRAEGFPRSALLPGRTSGSTGEPLLFYSTKSALYDRGYARSLRSMGWAGIRLGDRTVSVRMTRQPETARGRTLRRLSRRLERTIEVDTTSISVETLPGIVHMLHRVRPRAFGAYPSVMAHFASFIKDSGQPAPPVHSVLTGGEQLFEHQRELIREVFHSEPYSRYGSHEAYEMAAECEEHSGLHVHAEDIIAEVVDDGGNPVLPGQQGHILITSLHNYGMPFIRYKNGDAGSLATSSCPCGRGLPLLDTLLGRTGDFIYTPSGKRVAGVSLPSSRLALLGV
ncbi:MAG: phenylacetate--CoA ligase family protein, partial [Chloroflexi bacterium]|nr:phenylacetate--CoA ligase family protein [Chloroflexota bacterium]